MNQIVRKKWSVYKYSGLTHFRVTQLGILYCRYISTLALILFSLLPSGGQDASLEPSMDVNNILIKAIGLKECVYSSRQIKSIGKSPGSETFSTNFFRVGFYKDNYYVLMFRSMAETTNCLYAIEGHGRYLGSVWRFSGGIVFSETNSLPSRAPSNDGWIFIATAPLNLGMPPFKHGSAEFLSSNRFHFTDFMTNQFRGDISRSTANSNECVISLTAPQTAGFSRSITLTWDTLQDSTGLKLPSRIITRAGGVATKDMTIQSAILLLNNANEPDFSPERIAGCKLQVIARGTDSNGNVRVTDLNGTELQITSKSSPPNKRNTILIVLIVFTLSSLCALVVFLRRHSNKTK